MSHHPIRHHERLTIRACQKLVGFGVAGEFFGRRVEGQLPAESIVQTVERHSVVLQVLFHAGEGLVRVLVIAKGLGRLAEGNLASQPVGDIGQMAKGGGVVALEDFGVQVFRLAAANGRDEVAEVAVARPTLRLDVQSEPGQGLSLVAPLAGELVADEGSLLEMGDVADLLTLVPAGREAPHFEDELRVSKIHDADLRVGGLALVAIAEPAADAEH